MQRREFLTLGGTAALAGVAAPRIAYAQESIDTGGVAAVIARLDKHAEDTRAWFAHGREASRNGALAEAVEQLWVSIATYAAFVELAVAQQVHPSVQARIRRAAVGFGRAAEKLAGVFDSDDAEMWAELEAGAAHIPETKDALRAAEHEAHKLGVSNVNRRRLMTMTRRALEGIEKNGLKETARSLRGSLVASPQPPVDATLRTSAVAAHGAWVEAGVTAEPESEMTSSEDKAYMDTAMLAWGIVSLVAGAAVMYIGVVGMAAIPWCPCIGAFVFIMGLLAIIGGIALIVLAQKRPDPQPKLTGH